MKIEAENIILRDGRTLILRSPEEKDAKTMLDYLIRVSEETHFLIRYPEEIDGDTEEEKRVIKKLLESEDSAWLTVFDGDKVIGNCAVSSRGPHLKLKHRCDLAIAILQDYCGCGLGTILIKKACQKALEFGFEQVELGVYEDNERGLSLYRKLGFRETGRNPGAFKLKDGTYIDEISMVRFL